MQAMNRRMSMNTQTTPFPIMGQSPMANDNTPFFSGMANPHMAAPNIPYFIKPLPPRIGPDEVAYLEKKGALTVPTGTLRNELLKAYIDYVHPYMPLLDLYDFVMIVESGNGTLGRISLILFQAVMFAGCGFVDMNHLHAAGYLTRKEARRDFFQKTRLLYDFDYESDRVSLVQALLLLTYYYETPDDQKDTWHWMGVATAVAHTIGLHRNPERSNMDSKRTKLWKRIWWSTYMRDRLIALGMRRPTRIKSEDFNVPMLTLDDFECVPIPESVTCVSSDCLVARDVERQRQLAVMCIEKAKLCLCISHVLSKQYCVLNNNQGLVNDRTTMMLLPKKLDPETSEVRICDDELQAWYDGLPPEAQYHEGSSGNDSIDLNKSLLHMVFFTTLSALHRPQVLPSTPSSSPSSPAGSELLDRSRTSVRRAATAITAIAQQLDKQNLVRFLPTTGVTVLLPAIIIHLLDIKCPNEETRKASLRGFCQCMHVMGKLRELYAAADYSTAFLEAAIRKAGIQIGPANAVSSPQITKHGKQRSKPATVADLVSASRSLDGLISTAPSTTPLNLGTMAATASARTLTPPPDPATLSPGHQAMRVPAVPGTISDPAQSLTDTSGIPDEEVARRLETFLASTPPGSHTSESGAHAAVPASGDSSYGSHDDDVMMMDVMGAKGAKLAPVGAGLDGFRELSANLKLDDLTGKDGEALMLWGAGGVPEFEGDDAGAFESLLDWEGVAGGDMGELKWDELDGAGNDIWVTGGLLP
ncbi:hypothetical protein P152DRAFT_453426 [Eremomyces bilateralis CBS 781.70]|uniref:Xylanolytic transcriptional activator regulatory domain-containing protein n=1 Tax=Eremomyces bilateralis CBS 781.70 TaxID=1392243 RepID=A0A6G1GG04_9PEZI|nr:uncharacterized protein P152DRAFT_453426 [Eremomyces bilateralis CBS 781.70]KAF1816799.1 hypothetical protein P152DRAFT_453426 [Eremomyces bilateralis CBS 781.70]